MRYVLDFRELRSGGAVVPGLLTRADGAAGDPVAELALARDVVILLHGFNVDRAEGREKLERLAEMLPSRQDAALVATLWPGDHWLGPLSYPLEWRDARDTAAELVRFVRDTVRRDAALSFATHSLGARVAMDAVASLWQLGYRIAQVCLMAPAIDDDSLSDYRVYRRATLEAARAAVLSSVEDEVLRFAYPAGDLLQTLFYGGESWGAALGFSGPRPEPAHAQPVPGNVHHVAIPAARGADHGDYLPAASPNAEQRSAAGFADAVLAGRPAPGYPPS